MIRTYMITCNTCRESFAKAEVSSNSKRSLENYHNRRGPDGVTVEVGEGTVSHCACKGNPHGLRGTNR